MLKCMLTFPEGRFDGTGHWINQTAEGDYLVTYVITSLSGGESEHTVHRVFLNPDGSTLYEERSTVTFSPALRNGLRVTIRSAQGEVPGSGYWFDEQFHYEADVGPDNHFEWTFTVGTTRIEGLASATNKGNFTSWKETLDRV